MEIIVTRGMTNEFGETLCLSTSEKSGNVKSLIDFCQLFAATLNSESDDAIDHRYNENFLFVDKHTSSWIEINKLKLYTQKLKQKYKDNGFRESRVKRFEYLFLDSDFALVKVFLTLVFIIRNTEKEIDNINATYIVKRVDENWKILVQIDHQNLYNTLKAMGVIKD